MLFSKNIRLSLCSVGYFFSLKKFTHKAKIFAKKFSLLVVIMKGKITAFAAAKGGEKMQPTEHEIHKQHAFDCYCKKILKNEAYNIQKEYARLREKEISFDELSEKEQETLSVSDEYFAEEYVFDVLDSKIPVRNEHLANALQSLSERKRDIIILSYFLDMTDKEIAVKLNMVRKTVQYHRTKSLQELRKRLEEESHE